MSYLELKGISKLYENSEVKSVDDFNLKIEEGEFIVFVGPSGCGKSTTIRMIAGLEDITSGEILLEGKLLNKVHPKDRDIAMVFQNYALYPHMTIYDNIAFGLKSRKVNKKEIDEKVSNIAEKLNLTDYLDKKPKNLSGGQSQRVALGRAIVRDPKLFLMDEPLSNLDAKLRTVMRKEITTLHEELKATTIYVTHDQVEAMTMADRIVILKDGLIQQVGTPIELYERPKNTFVAGFIGSPKMNLIEANIINNKIVVNDDISFDLVAKDIEESEVIIGIRPEDIKTTPLELETYPTFSCDIINCELLGSHTNVFSEINNTSFVTTVKSNINTLDNTLKFAINPSKVHIFDRKTGNRLN